jgi:hypothetical protein
MGYAGSDCSVSGRTSIHQVPRDTLLQSMELIQANPQHISLVCNYLRIMFLASDANCDGLVTQL